MENFNKQKYIKNTKSKYFISIKFKNSQNTNHWKITSLLFSNLIVEPDWLFINKTLIFIWFYNKLLTKMRKQTTIILKENSKNQQRQLL